ncbi:NUDIX domain-containing protein [Avrilella dinanensis]|uniref:NUDIX hydrolase n=1 Tax=Avrilella dinanensis TaxID=2008672 RepID=A0A2M9R694_9FLAO|nr:NUDIX hydrolase [Avrilella dinanensis]PJR04398.1 NUDIX hydrolase [Avrilella dinanensis]
MAKEYVSKIFVTVDIVVFREKNTQKEILLIQRKNEPFKNQWALPGGFVDNDEDLETAAKRELREETCVVASNLQQVKAYGNPYRDPRGYMVSVVYFTTVDSDTNAVAADDAKALQWFTVENLPDLAFDHQTIIEDTLAKVFK